jgi:hypothetical protein
MQRLTALLGGDDLFGTSAYGGSDMQRIECRQSKLHAYLVGMSHDSIGVRRPVRNGVKKFKVKFRLVGFAVESSAALLGLATPFGNLAFILRVLHRPAAMSHERPPGRTIS